MYCNHCGAANPDNATFCRNCGHYVITRELDEPTVTYPPQTAASLPLGPEASRTTSIIADLRASDGAAPPTVSPKLRDRRILLVVGMILLVTLLAGLAFFVFYIQSGKNNTQTQSNGQTKTIEIPAIQPWTDTGIDLTVNELVTISASGKIIVNQNNLQQTAAGTPWDVCSLGARSRFIAPELPCTSLIARFGQNGQIFEVGTGKRFVVTTSGRLYLGVNDNYFLDNSGSWSVTIVVQPPQ